MKCDKHITPVNHQQISIELNMVNITDCKIASSFLSLLLIYTQFLGDLNETDCWSSTVTGLENLLCTLMTPTFLFLALTFLLSWRHASCNTTRGPFPPVLVTPECSFMLFIHRSIHSVPRMVSGVNQALRKYSFDN